MNDTTAGAISIAYCPNCGKVGEYVTVVDGVVKTIACKCGYNAPGMAVVGQRSDITATDIVTVRRDDLLAMEEEIKGLKAYADRLAAGLPDGMLPKDVENLRAANAGLAQQVQDLAEARDAAVLVAGVYQAQADALAEKVQAGIEYASRYGRIDPGLMIEKLGGTVEPRDDAPMQGEPFTCSKCHTEHGRITSTPGGFRLTVTGATTAVYSLHGECPTCGAPLHWTNNDERYKRLMGRVSRA